MTTAATNTTTDISSSSHQGSLPQGSSHPSLSKADLEEAFRAGRKLDVLVAFKDGINYIPPHHLVATSGRNWVFQPHPDLYKTLATNVLEHYDAYNSNMIDKTYVPIYFYLGGAGTGKSRHASEFVFSVQEAIKFHTNLAQRLKKSFVFHVSFENGTPLLEDEMSNLWNAVGVRMLQQLLREPIDQVRSQYVAEPGAIFRLVAEKANVDLYKDFTGILVVDGVHKALARDDDGRNKNGPFYRLLTQIGSLSLMSRGSFETEEGKLRIAPFIMTCVTATFFGPIEHLLADSHRKRVFLPLNRLQAPTWKNDNSPVLRDSPFIRLLVKDVGGHARAMELIADELAQYQIELEPNISDFATAIYGKLMDRYSEAVSLLRHYAFPIVQCILSRQQISLQDLIPGSKHRWEHVTASGLIWFEAVGPGYDTDGYLVAPYIWLWMLARLPPSQNALRLCEFLTRWKFNDYAELVHLETGEGLPGDTTWQSFEVFCCSFRILRSLGFEDGQEVPLDVLHSGCKLRDDRKTMVVNRHLDLAKAACQYETKSTDKEWSAEEVETKNKGTLNADAQLSHVILNGTSAPFGDFFFSIKIPTQRALNGRGSLGETVREVGQCKLVRAKLSGGTYEAEREKSAGPDDIFVLYTQTRTPKDCALPDRSGLVDASCWDSYFGPFSGRAYLALRSSSQD
jgi:hypothetical protein